MKVVMVGYGGMNFARPDGEEFPSLAAAKRVFAECTNVMVDKRPFEDGGPERHIYFGTLETWCPANGADVILSFGPGGGARAK